jgi:hypothetical protein
MDSTLRKAIAYHVKEEEGSIFPEMQKSPDAALLERLSGQIEDARSVLETPPRSAERDSPGYRWEEWSRRRPTV